MSVLFQRKLVSKILYAALCIFTFVQIALPHGYALHKIGEAKPIITLLKSAEGGGFKPFLTFHSIVKTSNDNEDDVQNQEDFLSIAKIAVISPVLVLPFFIVIFDTSSVKWFPTFLDTSPHFALLYLPPKTGPPSLLF